MLKAHYSCPMEAGTDEAGRGCLAGPVTAAAVILPEDFSHPLLNDSKKVSAKHRKELAQVIRESAITFAIAHIPHTTIDRINILNASIEAMHQALDKLDPRPHFIAVDGNRFKPYHKIPYQCLIRGDGRFMNIAAASILAKTSRDALMQELHEQYPEYQWNSNKGYPTAAHREALLQKGPSPYHRKSFRLKEEQLKIDY